VTSVAAVIPAASASRLASRLSVIIASTPVERPRGSACGDCRAHDPAWFREAERRAHTTGADAQQAAGSPMPEIAIPYLGSGSSTLCPPATWQPALRATSKPPRRVLASYSERADPAAELRRRIVQRIRLVRMGVRPAEPLVVRHGQVHAGPTVSPLPPEVDEAVQAVLADLASAPWAAPETNRLRELGTRTARTRRYRADRRPHPRCRRHLLGAWGRGGRGPAAACIAATVRGHGGAQGMADNPPRRHPAPRTA
jgi:hypothetical protein